MRTSHVQIVSRAAADAIRETLERDGFRLGAAPHALFEAVGSDVRVTYYEKRGKLLIQGQGTDGLLLRLRDTLGENALLDPGDLVADGGDVDDPIATINEPTIGTDESGKGDYFGSLVVAGCLVSPSDLAALRAMGVRDSKDASERTILAAVDKIRARVPSSVVELDPVEYGRMHQETGNVNKILGYAHAKVIRELLGTTGSGGSRARRVIIDRFGSESHVEKSLGSKKDGLEIHQVPRAERNLAVAAASFLARERFLVSLKRLSDDCGVDLLPGASAAVEARARKVYAVGGMDLLKKVAKVHFKTTERVAWGAR